MSEPFIAEIRIFAGNFAPRGWAFCDGQLLPVASNTAVFSLIGTTYGGDGRTTTALPNLQGRAPMHPGRGPGLTARRLGEKVGVETVTLADANMPSHNHAAMASENDRNSTDPNNRLLATTAEDFYDNSNKVNMHASTLSNTGSGQAHGNIQPFTTLNFIFALVGLYPSRS